MACSVCVFCRKKPVGAISDSTSSREAAARSTGPGKRANSSGVTLLTRWSVHWALSTVATSNSQGEEKSNSQWASGYVLASARKMALAC